LVLARGLSEQVELQGATGSDHGKGWSTRSRSTRDRMGFERFPKESPLVEEVSYLIDHGEARLRVDVDHFGQINWFFIKGVPEIYDLMKIALASTSENVTPFWKY
ncbi:hypothetical protein, partial [Acidovorax sp. SUPP2825]|uniref:hypothetical protein n=1 Tax=Acidovorax sp. SUPP2825 TaxID=2920879 RepID=UPI0024E12850